MAEGRDKFIARRERLEFVKEHKTPREFFYFVDYASTPPVVKESAMMSRHCATRRIDEILELRSLLTRRVLERGEKYRDHLPTPAVEAVSNVEGLARVSSSLLGACLQSYRLADGGIDFAGLETAFELFANGELMMDGANGIRECEPDSGHYFAFAELAFAAIENQIECFFWKTMANALTRTIEVFLRTRIPPLARRTLPMIVGKFTTDTYVGPLPPADIAEIRSRYTGMDTDTLRRHAGRMAHCALKRGEFC